MWGVKTRFPLGTIVAPWSRQGTYWQLPLSSKRRPSRSSRATCESWKCWSLPIHSKGHAYNSVSVHALVHYIYIYVYATICKCVYIYIFFILVYSILFLFHFYSILFYSILSIYMSIRWDYCFYFSRKWKTFRQKNKQLMVDAAIPRGKVQKKKLKLPFLAWQKEMDDKFHIG